MSSIPPTHRALRQDVYAQPPTVQQIPTPQVTPGSAVLRVLQASVISYTKDIYNGVRQYPYPTPLTLGQTALARVAALGPDATTLRVGDLCLLDVTIRGRDDIDRAAGATFLSAIAHGHTPAAARLFRDAWRDGTYAEYVRWPLENCFVLDEDRLLTRLGYRLGDLMFIPKMLVAYGGLGPLCVDLKPGETVVVSPATGGFGSAAVHLCLELGAGRVICMGRNQEILADLKTAIAPEKRGRIETVPLTGDWEEDSQALKGLGGVIDVFFDISPPAAAESRHLKAGVIALRNGGRMCLMGGGTHDVVLPHGMLMRKDITLKGKWMYEPVDVKRLIALVETGVVKLHREADAVNPLGARVVATFKLEEWEQAFDVAEKQGRSGGIVVMEP
ncbi:Alcohol dehydrogenase GroES-like domain-containing protein [Cladophialophora immunda]|nr:Alcohol dehydrogenase GroES-like domain-containing protein [Cladophialophora immunda]